jgi:replicative DNA helicase
METKKTFIDHEQEKQALGGILIDSNVLFNSIQMFLPEMFDNPEHMTIAKVMVDLFNRGEMVDTMNVVIELRAKKFTNIFYVTELTNNLPYTSGYEKIVASIHSLWITRKVNRIIEGNHFKLHTQSDTLEVMEGLQKELTEALNTSTIASEVKGGKVYQNVVEHIDQVRSKPNKLVGIDTGIRALNSLTGGWQPTELIIIAARPGMGKTSFMLTSAKAAAFGMKKKVGIISLEMSNEQLMNKLISIDTGIGVQRIKSIDLGDYDVQAIKAAKTQLNDNFIFEDKVNTLTQIRSKCRQMVVKYGVEGIYIDYLQLISNKGKGNREQEISEISRTLKMTAKELNIPIIALSQLSRSVEQRGGEKVPQLSDLRESGAIEQDADIVAFVHRPNYYVMDNLPIEEDAKVIVAKNRNGSTGAITMHFKPNTTQFICPSTDRPSALTQSNEF